VSTEEETTVSLSSGSFEDIEKRRKLVIEMLFQGTPTTVMADLCGVDRRTIEADIEYVKKQSAKRIREMMSNRGAVDEMLGDMLTSLDYIRQNAFMEYAGSTTEMGKNGFLNTGMKATSMMARLLMDTGVIPKAGQDVNIRSEHRVTFAARFGDDSPLAELDDDTKRRKILDAVGKVLKITPKAALPGPGDIGPVTPD
jgi:hypothetical protein